MYGEFPKLIDEADAVGIVENSGNLRDEIVRDQR